MRTSQPFHNLLAALFATVLPIAYAASGPSALRAYGPVTLQDALTHTSGAVTVQLLETNTLPPSHAGRPRELNWNVYGLAQSVVPSGAVQKPGAPDPNAPVWEDSIRQYCSQIFADYDGNQHTIRIFWPSQNDRLRRNLGTAIVGLGLRNVYCVIEARLASTNLQGERAETTPLYFVLDTRPTSLYALGTLFPESLPSKGPRGSIPLLLNGAGLWFQGLPIDTQHGTWNSFPASSARTSRPVLGIPSIKREYIQVSTESRIEIYRRGLVAVGGTRVQYIVNLAIRPDLGTVTLYKPPVGSLAFGIKGWEPSPRPGSGILSECLSKVTAAIDPVVPTRIVFSLASRDEARIATKGGCRFLLTLGQATDPEEAVYFPIDVIPASRQAQSDNRALATALTPINIPAYADNPVRSGRTTLRPINTMGAPSVDKARVILEAYDLYQFIASDKLNAYGRGIRLVLISDVAAGSCKSAGGYAKYGSSAFTWCPNGAMRSGDFQLEVMESLMPYRSMLIDHESRHARLKLRHDKDKNYAPCMGTALSAELGLRIYQSDDDVLSFMRQAASGAALQQIYYAYGYDINEPKLKQGRCKEMLDALSPQIGGQGTASSAADPSGLTPTLPSLGTDDDSGL